MSINVKNARVVYSLFCRACATGVTLKGFDDIPTDDNHHLMVTCCPSCGTSLSVNYDKAQNMVVATVKEQAQ